VLAVYGLFRVVIEDFTESTLRKSGTAVAAGLCAKKVTALKAPSLVSQTISSPDRLEAGCYWKFVA
jgi:hypothetical protein